MEIEEARVRFLWPHQKLSNFKKERNGFVSFCIEDHIKHDFWYVLTNGDDKYVTSAQYKGLAEE